MFPRPRDVFLDDTGTVTVEQALAMITAAVLAGVLLLVVSGESVREGFADLVDHALKFSG
jgi:hypothetical protein